MAGFNASWLSLREEIDERSRDASLVARVSAALSARPMTDVGPTLRSGVRAIDLGGGTGANVRYLAPRLPAVTDWLVVDDDPALLAQVRPPFRTLRLDLNEIDAARLGGYGLVTASALLDLVSRAWLDRLLDACAATGAAVLFALSYDGRFACEPRDAEDEAIRDLVNRHQRTDKGFGPALGPDAARIVEGRLRARGYQVLSGASDWQVGAEIDRLQRLLIDGWAEAASAMAPEGSSWIADWRARRLAFVDAQRSRLIVGHVDVAGWL